MQKFWSFKLHNGKSFENWRKFISFMKVLSMKTHDKVISFYASYVGFKV
jgi:hypothetical protein